MKKEYYSECPYVVRYEEIGRKFKPIGEKEVEFVDAKTGEVVRYKQVNGIDRFYDRTKFIKIYDFTIFTKLTRGGICLLSYIMENMDYKGVVNIDIDEIMKVNKYKSRKSVVNAIEELMSLDIMRPKNKIQYWIDPNKICRGARQRYR